MTAKYGEDEMMWPFIDERIYFDTFGPARRGRYYGLGSGGIGACTVRSGRSSVASSSYVTQAAPTAVPSGSHQEDLHTQMADMQTRLQELASLHREQLVNQAATSGTTPSQEDFGQRVHEAFQREFAIYQTQLDARMEQRFGEEAKKADEERKKAEEERKKAEEARKKADDDHWSSFDVRITSLDSRLDSRFSVLRSSLLSDIASLLKIPHSDASASSSHHHDPPPAHD